jgi:hypothetical protein
MKVQEREENFSFYLKIGLQYVDFFTPNIEHFLF